MKRNLMLLSALLAIVLWAVTSQASQALRLSLEELADEADLVALVEVERCESAWGPNKRLIHTRCELSLVETLAGQGPSRVEIVQPGGQVGRWGQVTHGYHRFAKGERVLVFLRQFAGRAKVVGMSQGVFRPTERGWRQALSGLSFPGDSGQALDLRANEMIERIRSAWSMKEGLQEGLKGRLKD